jgi:hypothetical protein
MLYVASIPPSCQSNKMKQLQLQQEQQQEEVELLLCENLLWIILCKLLGKEGIIFLSTTISTQHLGLMCENLLCTSCRFLHVKVVLRGAYRKGRQYWYVAG